MSPTHEEQLLGRDPLGELRLDLGDELVALALDFVLGVEDKHDGPVSPR